MSFCIVVSPAKKMNVVDSAPYAQGSPVLLDRTAKLMEAVRALSRDEAKALWRCSDKLADLNYERFEHMDLNRDVTAAVLSYEGIQYQHLQASVMDEQCLGWLGAHLRILSGFYGVLQPFDGVVPYRLEMQAKLSVGSTRDLYEYWGGSLFDALVAQGCTCVVNLASVEYAKAVVPFARAAGMPVLTCLFGTVRQSDGKLLQRATEAKAARGTFVRWCAENAVESTAAMRDFSERGYALNKDRSSSETLVFVRV